MDPPKRSRSGRRTPGWIELSVALTALVASVVSLYIARQQTEVMHRQLAASIWPAVQYSTSNLRAGEPVITLSLENVGVGPARMESFRVWHQGQEVPDLTAFIMACCAPEGRPFRTITSFVEGRVLPAGQSIDFLTLPAAPGQEDVYARFDRARRELEIELCYCSVLEECWSIARPGGEGVPVDRCEAPGAGP